MLLLPLIHNLFYAQTNCQGTKLLQVKVNKLELWNTYLYFRWTESLLNSVL